MAASDSLDPVGLVREQLASASPDLLQAMVRTFAEALMSAEADALCGASYGQRSEERVNHRNGYRAREWDTRVGTVELAIPKLRQGSYFPDWCLSIASGPYRFVWVDALAIKVREGGRTVNVHALVAVGVNADGHREVLGPRCRLPGGRGPGGWHSCAHWSLAACLAFGW